jgi:hypothetical protein
LIEYQKSSLKIQTFYRSSREKQNKSIDKKTEKKLSNQFNVTHRSKAKKQSEYYTSSSSSSDLENNEYTSKSNLIKPTHEEKEKTLPLKYIYPSWIPLGIVSNIRCRIIRATGLQEAAKQVAKDNSLLQLASSVGVNAFVAMKELLPVTPESGVKRHEETMIQARTFTPIWNYVREMDFVLDEAVYKHFMEHELQLEIYHRNQRLGDQQKDIPKNVLIGTTSVPLNKLITSRNGIQGWYNIYGKDSMVGAIDVSITLDSNTLASIFSDRPFDIGRPVSNTIPYDVCKFILFIEEIDIPEQIVKQYCPYEWLQKSPMFSCYYHLTYRFFGESKYHINIEHII